MLNKIYYGLDHAAHYMFSVMYCNRSYKHYKKMYKRNGIKIARLTSKEKSEIKKKWHFSWEGTPNYATYRLYKSITGEFSADICPENLFRTVLEPKLINKKIRDAWDDKNYFEKFLPDIPFPEVLARNIHGKLYDSKYNPIGFATALDKIKNNFPVIIKPSIDSGLSRGVKKIDNVDNIKNIISQYTDNYIIQKVIVPCAEFSKLSINSVPIIRMITLFVDDEPVFVSGSLRTNTCEAAVADNFIDKEGKGMLVIGIDETGKLGKKGVYSGGLTIDKMPNGFEFGGLEIPKFDELVNIVLEAHKQMPMFKSIGWDVTLDENYNPIVMEYNLKGMGIYYYQLVNGPLFGKYTDEIIKKYL